jgi:hypothetical protein
VLRLGSILLTGVLLGVPRALDARAFGGRRPVYVEISPVAPELVGLAEEIERALAAANWTLVPRREATTVIEVTAVAHTIEGGRPIEAFTLSLLEGRRARRLVLHAESGRRSDIARAVVQAALTSES